MVASTFTIREVKAESVGPEVKSSRSCWREIIADVGSAANLALSPPCRTVMDQTSIIDEPCSELALSRRKGRAMIDACRSS